MTQIMRATAKILHVSALVLVLTQFLIQSARSNQVDYTGQANTILNSDNTPSATGNQVRVGTFASGFNFALNANNYTATNSAFIEIGRATITGVPAQGMFTATALNTTVPVGQQLYMWLFNSPNPSASANGLQWAIISDTPARDPNFGPFWVAPDPASAISSTAIDTGDTGVFVPTGALGQIVAANNVAGFNVRLSPVNSASVPEPTTLVLLGLGLSGFSVCAMRRRQTEKIEGN